ncbi:FAD-dependent oxidoreductase [Beijerinckiaceae bacterium]|nr:FAD-dependent oxidoreductase [Beijerinckiaceae bacterium]
MSDAGERAHILIVGASLAGLRGAEALRRNGFRGKLTIIGDEPHRPYDRPPLSKSVLTGTLNTDHLDLPNLFRLDAEWRLGKAAIGLDPNAREVTLDDGERLGFDKLLIATGARARPWPYLEEARLAGIFTLRTRDDAQALRSAFDRKPRRVLIVGAGFNGCEIASCCCDLGLPVTLVDPYPAPLAGVMGSALGAILGAIMLEQNVEWRGGSMVTHLEGDGKGRVRRAELSDKTIIDTDLVVIATGALRNIEWLRDAKLQSSGLGVICDKFCRALHEDGTVAADIFAAGDVARWPHPLYDDRIVSLEHWGNAVEQAGVCAHNMLAPPGNQHPYVYLPAFWSSQFGINIKSVGLADFADRLMFVQGSRKERRFVALFGREQRSIAAFSFNSARWLPAYAQRIAERALFAPLQGGSDQPDLITMAPGFPSSLAGA